MRLVTLIALAGSTRGAPASAISTPSLSTTETLTTSRSAASAATVDSTATVLKSYIGRASAPAISVARRSARSFNADSSSACRYEIAIAEYSPKTTQTASTSPMTIL